MYYKVEGKGRSLLFIHGLSDNLLYWNILAAHLRDDYQIIRIDLRGHGSTDLGTDKISIGLFVNDLKKLLDELNIKKVDLIGFSLGGAIALDFSIKYPDMVSSIVLMSSFAKSDDYLTDVFIQLKNALKAGFETYYDLILPLILCPEVINDNKSELEYIKKAASKTANTGAYIKAIDACLDFNVENELSVIDVPVLILAGRYDGISLLDSQMNLQKKIANSRLFIFDNVKHNLLIGENVNDVVNILKDFYES
ncbi:MAG: hypothetical protein BZ138_01950 [Methanosphaera sp. rholeuAM270]|nr:MAG: hypothetical protein BZ138_01950 [Methanosphaera sp. rholeuAM270]